MEETTHITIEFLEDEFDLISQYQDAVGALTVQDAILRAVRVALDSRE